MSTWVVRGSIRNSDTWHVHFFSFFLVLEPQVSIMVDPHDNFNIGSMGCEYVRSARAFLEDRQRHVEEDFDDEHSEAQIIAMGFVKPAPRKPRRLRNTLVVILIATLLCLGVVWLSCGGMCLRRDRTKSLSSVIGSSQPSLAPAASPVVSLKEASMADDDVLPEETLSPLASPVACSTTTDPEPPSQGPTLLTVDGNTMAPSRLEPFTTQEPVIAAAPSHSPSVSPSSIPSRLPTMIPSEDSNPASVLLTEVPSAVSMVPNASPTSLPSASPPAIPTMPGPLLRRPFSSTWELYQAVDAYLLDPSSTTRVARRYGHPIGTWQVGALSDFSRVFSAVRNVRALYFNEPLDGWDTSRATTMEGMFRKAEQFDQDLPWNTSNVRNMDFMFLNANQFDGSLDWDVSQVTSMRGMFQSAPRFTGRRLSSWNTAAVTSLQATFAAASNFDANLDGWDVSSVTSLAETFLNAASFRSDLGNWRTSRVTSLRQTFQGAVSFNGSVGDWNVTAAQYFRGTFVGAMRFRQNMCAWPSRYDMYLATSCPAWRRNQCNSCDGTKVGNSNLETSSTRVRIIGNRTELELAVDSYLQDIVLGELSIVNQEFPLKWWDTSRVRDFGNLFSTFRNPAAVIFNGDISRWNTSNVISMSSMFAQAYSFQGDLSQWDTSNVRKLNSAFQHATSFNSDIGNWDVSSVENAGWAFRGATSFNQDLNGWKLSAESLTKMFAGATQFNQSLCSWESAGRGMFSGTSCPVESNPDGFSYCHRC